jgi:hypothetical protein
VWASGEGSYTWHGAVQAMVLYMLLQASGYVGVPVQEVSLTREVFERVCCRSCGPGVAAWVGLGLNVGVRGEELRNVAMAVFS